MDIQILEKLGPVVFEFESVSASADENYPSAEKEKEYYSINIFESISFVDPNDYLCVS